MLLHDPDADGIHIGALLLLHVARRHAALLEAGAIERVHAPIGEVRVPDDAPPVLAFGDAHFRALCERASTVHGAAAVARRYGGLGSLSPAVLRFACVDPATRLTCVLGPDDARCAAEAFGGARRAAETFGGARPSKPRAPSTRPVASTAEAVAGAAVAHGAGRPA